MVIYHITMCPTFKLENIVEDEYLIYSFCLSWCSKNNFEALLPFYTFQYKVYTYVTNAMCNFVVSM